ncbi:MAG: AMP-binding protein [Actinomycetota bacterium]|nr:AMP-binding protein [Actinomycetota bacterium]
MISKIVARASSVGLSARVLTQAGVVRPISPVALVRVGRAVAKWGTGPAGGFATLAARWPDKPGLIDELGSITFGEIHQRSNALAHALRDLGVSEGDSVAVMCRNHRYFVDATVAAAKLGADILYLNTAFAGPQLVEVLEREAPSVVVHDEEFGTLLDDANLEKRVLAWTDSDGAGGGGGGMTTVESLIKAGDTRDLTAPDRHSRVVILTSGTTGTPKGAPRNEAGIDAAVALLERIPLRAGTRVYIAAPLFHTWGFAHMALGMLLGTTAVLRRKFDPEGALEVAQEETCDAMVVIPIMLQRIMALPQETLDSYDVSSLRVVSSSGSALPGGLAESWMDTFSDNLYSTYGSTEVAYGSIATPADLRAAPGTAGRPPVGTVVKILDADGNELPHGESGRIFVGNSLLFEGYTGGGNKDMIDGLMSSGDVGRFGDDGRLYVEGRDDEMIVSGGENVFPKEIEDCLSRHEAVTEVAAIGVVDDDFGQRLKAFVVLTDSSCSEDDLKGWVKQNLARYKVPREIVFIDELPRNATGKVLKRELVEDDHEPSDS